MAIKNTKPFTVGTTQTNNSPTVVAWGSNSFMVFHVGVDNKIYYTVVNPSNQNWWGTWYPVPNQSTNMPVRHAARPKFTGPLHGVPRQRLH